ncbi:MFS transporter, DHA2 family, multidrug resistance protein [Filimonas lacunae]|uniref:MFS transporter, DHA2 family, multidrug resistance protein n=1 Tax=Filimonas lacunae TaxID=477680 RepID=A0A173MF24_9BACT|nr:DHA2 family efflux MFS transporter permease subunit [Filimonas lacunae]BAV06194.1 inner membrane component of tripartite multidrug resistance system [Filimonas lacunae]SIT25213.1 MFS transporter, DHA2 family, multidrug resistance protein [Filimonas lacunae]
MAAIAGAMPTYEVGARKWLITITVITCAIMELIDTSIVNVATRQIAGNLGATVEETAWVITAYAISNIIIIPLTGFLGDVFGRKNYFTASIILFTVASFMCGFSGSIWTLVAWRFIQGIGGGALLATAQTVLVETFPPEELDKANGIFGAGIVMGPTLGPVLGGYLTDNYSWSWIFYINIPIGIAAAILSWKFIKGAKTKLVGKVDYWGIAALVVGIGSLQMLLEEGERKDWFSSKLIIIVAILAVAGIGLFIVRELTAKNPVVDLRVLRFRNVAVGSALRFAFGLAIYCSVFLYPVFVQSFLGWNATRTGLLILPGALITGMLMGVNGALVKKGISPKALLLFGFGMVILYEYLSYRLATQAAGEWDFLWPQLIRGVGFGFIFVPAASLTLAGLKGKDIGQASGLSNMLQLLGGSVGLAIINTYVTRRIAVHYNDLMGNVSFYNPASNERMYNITSQLIASGKSPEQAKQMAMGVMNGSLSVQSAVISYSEGFMMIGIICAAILPLVFLSKIKKGESLEVGGVH